MPQENPYQEPDRAGDASHKSHFDLRAELETVVAVLATMLVAGGWAGAPYQPRSFILVLVLATAVSLLGMLGYAATTKRARILRFLPLVIIAVFGQELLAGLFALVGFLGVPIGVLFSLIRPTRQNWLVVGHLVLAVAAAMLSVSCMRNCRASAQERQPTTAKSSSTQSVTTRRRSENYLPLSPTSFRASSTRFPGPA